MKRVQTSKLLLLGVWFAVLLAGYMASRASVFAAVTMCIQCKDCENMDTWWYSASNTVAGTVWQSNGTPVSTAILGTNMGSLKDCYGGGCDGTSTGENCENMVTEVKYSSATPLCSPPYPIPNGTFAATDGQNVKPTDNSFCQTFCNP